MRVAVFGATGRVGVLVVEALLNRRQEVVSVSRSPPHIKFVGNYEAMVGDMTDSTFLRSVMEECDGLIFCIGQRLKSPNNLFSKNLSPRDIRTQIVTAVMEVIGSDPSERFVYLSAFGVGDELKRHALLFRAVLKLSSLGGSYEDHNRAEMLVRASTTNWTIVRPPGLTDKEEVVPLVDARGHWSSFMTVTKKSLAEYLVQTLENNNMDRQTLTIIEDNKERKGTVAAKRS